MTVKLLSEQELGAMHDDGNSLLTEDGRTMQAIDYPLYERLVAIARWAAKARVWMMSDPCAPRKPGGCKKLDALLGGDQ